MAHAHLEPGIQGNNDTDHPQQSPNNNMATLPQLVNASETQTAMLPSLPSSLTQATMCHS